MAKKFNPVKRGLGSASTTWWEGLSLEEKQHFKKHYEAVREWNATRKFGQYPDMYDTNHIRISQLSEKQICRIWVFKDHPQDRERYAKV